MLLACALIAAIALALPADAAVREVKAGESISAAIAAAGAGDTISVAPGVYREALKVTKPGLTITSATAPGGEPDVVVESPTETALTDSQNTVWRGLAFRAQGGGSPLANLTGFKGRVEYCRFDSGEETPGKVAVVISGGATFHGTTFANQGGNGEGVQITSGSPTFTYCRFENLSGGAVLVRDGGARFLNCLFLRNSHILNRGSGAKDVEMINSVLFLNTSQELFPGESSAKVRLDHCVYTPARNSIVENKYARDFSAVRDIETEQGVVLQDTATRSPRFVSLRRRGLLNFGIDDNRCIPLWAKITEEADKYEYPVTIAAHVSRLTPQGIAMLNKGSQRGHEVASHGVSHAPFNYEDGLVLNYYQPDIDSAYLTLGDDNIMKFYVDEKLMLEVPLGELGSTEALRMSDLVARLRKAGINVDVSEPAYVDIPATLLMKVSRFDLLFKNFSPTLGLQADKYMTYEIAESKKFLDANLSLQEPLTAIVYPHTVHSKRIAEEVVKAGFLCGRAGSTADTFSPYNDGFDPFCIYAENIKNQISPPDIAPEKMREAVFVLLDFINDSGSSMSLYSHAENELTLKNWGVLMKAVHDDGQATPMTLLDMTRLMQERGKLHDDARYYLTPTADESDYRLREDSPLKGAGKPVGLTRDFEGKELPKGNPSIGLYQ